MKLETNSLGTLEYEQKAIIHIQEGMLGFSQLKEYLLVENEDMEPFKMLQSVDDPYVAFPLIDPHMVFRNYSCAITLEDLRNLGIDQPSDVITLVVAVVAADPAESTVNLKAPLLINHHKMIAKQIVLTESQYATMQPLIPQRGL